MSLAYVNHCPSVLGVISTCSDASVTCVSLAQKYSSLSSLKTGALEHAKNEFARTVLWNRHSPLLQHQRFPERYMQPSHFWQVMELATSPACMHHRSAPSSVAHASMTVLKV
ncbi:hypothetical protein GN958_ATG17377 [Phytophthora infestans]|uniref:Uncharacterized protein n=1 Tax=Phytophthora infestans TaxID=4787 RepID=A0A8S9U5E0_PHYIN|nr:hypothetical protein GN958_ATG17377 [Phytophthora infestans]